MFQEGKSNKSIFKSYWKEPSQRRRSLQEKQPEEHFILKDLRFYHIFKHKEQHEKTKKTDRFQRKHKKKPFLRLIKR